MRKKIIISLILTLGIIISVNTLLAQTKKTVKTIPKSNNMSVTTNTPPLEKYVCTQNLITHIAYPFSSPTVVYLGNLTLETGGKYNWVYDKGKPDKTGRYVFNSKGLQFKGGKLSDVEAIFATEENGQHLIELQIKGEKKDKDDDGIIHGYCYCEKHNPDNND